jgi:hypothetical protein
VSTSKIQRLVAGELAARYSTSPDRTNDTNDGTSQGNNDNNILSPPTTARSSLNTPSSIASSISISSSTDAASPLPWSPMPPTSVQDSDREATPPTQQALSSRSQSRERNPLTSPPSSVDDKLLPHWRPAGRRNSVSSNNGNTKKATTPRNGRTSTNGNGAASVLALAKKGGAKGIKVQPTITPPPATFISSSSPSLPSTLSLLSSPSPIVADIQKWMAQQAQQVPTFQSSTGDKELGDYLAHSMYPCFV